MQDHRKEVPPLCLDPHTKETFILPPYVFHFIFQNSPELIYCVIWTLYHSVLLWQQFITYIWAKLSYWNLSFGINYLFVILPGKVFSEKYCLCLPHSWSSHTLMTEISSQLKIPVLLRNRWEMDCHWWDLCFPSVCQRPSRWLFSEAVSSQVTLTSW